MDVYARGKSILGQSGRDIRDDGDDTKGEWGLEIQLISDTIESPEYVYTNISID